MMTTRLASPGTRGEARFRRHRDGTVTGRIRASNRTTQSASVVVVMDRCTASGSKSKMASSSGCRRPRRPPDRCASAIAPTVTEMLWSGAESCTVSPNEDRRDMPPSRPSRSTNKKKKKRSRRSASPCDTLAARPVSVARTGASAQTRAVDCRSVDCSDETIFDRRRRRRPRSAAAGPSRRSEPSAILDAHSAVNHTHRGSTLSTGDCALPLTGRREQKKEKKGGNSPCSTANISGTPSSRPRTASRRGRRAQTL